MLSGDKRMSKVEGLKMKLKDGTRWYVMDLNNYTREFLIEIIQELIEDED